MNFNRFLSLIFLSITLYVCTVIANTSPIPVIVIDQIKTTDDRLLCNRENNKLCNLRIYQIMVESFVNGNPKIGFTNGYGNSHHSGDLQGIIDSLDYIRSLNVNAIWLTPIFDTGAANDKGDQLRLDATGYFAHDFFHIDSHFGNLEKARELVTKAHEKGLYVFFDGVFGHVKKTGVKMSPSGLKPLLVSCIKEPTNYPGLCVQYPESRDFFAEVATYWIDKLGIDGWRLDQAYQVPLEDWAYIQNKVLEVAQKKGKLGYMVSEIWSDEWIIKKNAHRIKQEAFGDARQPGIMSAFDFPLRYALVRVLATQEKNSLPGASHEPASLINSDEGFGSYKNYPDFAIPNLMIGNHDTVRFGNLLMRGHIANPNDPEYWQRHLLAFAFLTAYSGPITIYYGDEIGDFIPNFSAKITENCVANNLCDDHVSRTAAKILGVTVQTKDLSPQALQLKNQIAQLMKLKSEHPALYSGSRSHLASGKDYYIDLKQHGKEKIIFVMNTGKTAKVFQFKDSLFDGQTFTLQDLLSRQNYQEKSHAVSLTLPPLTAKFLLVNELK